jgi:two-component system cell cycle sensor histidine kinase/response regulator CckA
MTRVDLSRWFAGVAGIKTKPDAEPSPEANQREHVAVDTLPVTLFEFDANGIYTCVAGGYIGLFGITAESLIGRSIFDFPKFVPGKNVMVRRALAGETVSFTGIWPRGRFMIRLVPRVDADGRVSAVVGLGSELMKPSASDSYFEQLLEALRQSEARFRAMCDCAPLGIWVSNSRFELGYVNPALCALLERKADELLGRSWEATLHPDERRRLPRVLGGTEPVATQRVVHLLRKDGASVWASLRTAPMRDEGELIGYTGVIADITQERAARRAIDRAQQDLRRVIESSPEGIAVVRDQRWIFVNRALVEALGYEHAGLLIGHDANEIVHPDDRQRALALTFSQTEGSAQELRYARANGEYALMEMRAATLTEFEGAPAVLLCARDVTEHRNLQARLLMTERLLAVGTLAAGVAHEINNPLAAVQIHLDWLSAELARSRAKSLSPAAALAELQRLLGRLQEPIDEARDAVARVSAIVRDLKLFSRAEEELHGPVELTHVLDSAVRFACNELRHRARLVREYGALPLVHGSEARLGQVFLNLLINAAQAIPEGHAHEHEIRLVARATQAHVVVEVTDTGTGMTEDILGRIFDPFFTTKPPGIGTGLGLAICQRIVNSLGGQIEVESQLGRGSVFRVTLARAEPAAELTPPETVTTATSPEPRARVLVIDDDPAVGCALELVLSDDHEVEVFTSARRALARVQAGECYDAILCDIMMPEMSGMEFHGALTHTHPQLAAQIIFLTGGAFTVRAREFLDRISNPRLSKPFDMESLRALISEQRARTS